MVIVENILLSLATFYRPLLPINAYFQDLPVKSCKSCLDLPRESTGGLHVQCHLGAVRFTPHGSSSKERNEQTRDCLQSSRYTIIKYPPIHNCTKHPLKLLQYYSGGTRTRPLRRKLTNHNQIQPGLVTATLKPFQSEHKQHEFKLANKKNEIRQF